MLRRTSKRAFTLVELVMVIVIIGLLAAVVVPKFTDMRTSAQNAAETAAVSAVKSGIQLVHMTNLAQGSSAWPTALDTASNAAASASNPLFGNVVDGGLTDGNWSKTGANAYTYTPTGAHYTYDSATGNFTKS